MSSDRSTAETEPASPAAPTAGLPPPVDVGQTQPLQNDFQAPVAAENNYDDGALHPNQVAALQQHLAALRRENEAYLARHGELRTVVSDFIAGVVDRQPEDVRDFAAQFFAQANRKKKAKEAAAAQRSGGGEQQGQ
ncbi:hypothetical protein FJT64_007057 [Amphibalanus amphitrite]|uniref:RIIa domain-containing protein 1 n=1 Tax=Amphibalanus amphitrite TaxID=1232801 RepID=A0A6A4VXB9_AMPAM|nr:hypothetical protein FJT64_007057 [Amphibalanus amphitrite]